MPSPPDGPTAFVLAGGGTKGSFEVGALQYLVGVEGIVPQIVTATSAGAVIAAVLAQGRTLPEFVQRVDEIENDVLAMTSSERVFGKQAWLAALDGTALGRAINYGILEGTRPPFPLRGWADEQLGVPTRCAVTLVPSGPPGQPGAPPPAAPSPPSAGGRGPATAPGAASPSHQREFGPHPRTAEPKPSGPVRTASGRSTPRSWRGPVCSCAWR